MQESTIHLIHVAPVFSQIVLSLSNYGTVMKGITKYLFQVIVVVKWHYINKTELNYHFKQRRKTGL